MLKGLGAIQENLGSSNEYLKLKDGEGVVLRILVPSTELIAVWEHTEQFAGRWKTVTCLGKDTCPLCLAGKRASFKAYVPLLDTADDKVKIFKASRDSIKQIIGLVEEYGELNKNTFKLVRKGMKLDTTYQFFYKKDDTDYDLSQYDVPNIEEIVKPMEREAMIALMEGGASVARAAEQGKPAVETSTDDYPF